jgi:hypothetical protein
LTQLVDRSIAILDANVLYPFRKRDALLRFCQAGLFQARWTEKILNEWTATLLRRHPDMTASVQSQRHAMQRAFPEACIGEHEPLIPALVLPDTNDRHVLAAAISCGAQHIVTDNLKDFPDQAIRPLAIEALSADEFLSRLFDNYPAISLQALKSMRASYRKPPFTQKAFVDDLMMKGLPKLSSRLRETQTLL